jgi:hypothetical protein
LSGGENLGQAATDLALIGINNLSTGMLGLAMGGDVQPYQVGSYSNLNSLSSVGDGIQIHHAPQNHPASQVIGDYDYQNAPAIALPNSEHFAVNNANIRGSYSDTARNLLAKTVQDLRNYTNTPNSSLWGLIELFNSSFPGVLRK